jgi:hypothetical protein
MFESYPVRVFVGTKGTVKKNLIAWEIGLLKEATVENACAEDGRGHESHH